MPAYSASAPGKIILFGEHAVVYGRPAIAAPVPQVRAKAIIMAEPRSPRGQVRLIAPDIGLDATLASLSEDHPLAVVIQKAVNALHIAHLPACSIQITSTIPMAGGMGSGAAVSVAVLRALAAFLGQPLSDEQLSDLVYEAELIYHGSPSGIDNAVVTFARLLYFVKGKPPEFLKAIKPFTLIIGSTGVESRTSMAVGEVRNTRKSRYEEFEHIFDVIGSLAVSGRKAIETGNVEALGPLMNENQDLLAQIGVSSPELDALVETARAAGALGAKLSGAGRGGSMIALVTSETSLMVDRALHDAGAAGTILTEIGKP